MGELRAVTSRLRSAVDPVALGEFAGRTAKTAADDTVARHLGGDRAFSGMKRSTPLDTEQTATAAGVTLTMTPVALWTLADSGVRRSGVILPKSDRRRSRGRAAAVRTPRGFRALSRYRAGQFRGFRLLDDVERRLDTDVVDDVDRELGDRLEQV